MHAHKRVIALCVACQLASPLERQSTPLLLLFLPRRPSDRNARPGTRPSAGQTTGTRIMATRIPRRNKRGRCATSLHKREQQQPAMLVREGGHNAETSAAAARRRGADGPRGQASRSHPTIGAAGGKQGRLLAPRNRSAPRWMQAALGARGDGQPAVICSAGQPLQLLAGTRRVPPYYRQLCHIPWHGNKPFRPLEFVFTNAYWDGGEEGGVGNRWSVEGLSAVGTENV